MARAAAGDSSLAPTVRVLLVDPGRHLAGVVQREVGTGLPVEFVRVPMADAALQMFALKSFDLVLLQLRLPHFSGVELAAKLRRIDARLPLIAFSEEVSPRETEALTRHGYPLPLTGRKLDDEILQRFRLYVGTLEGIKEVAHRREELRRRFGFERILSRFTGMEALLERIGRVVRSKVPVLIEGESGTGKELIARMLHMTGDRAKRPFVTVNCAAVPEGLLESQFFGYEKGAFTGAQTRTPGRFETANGGTLFLDEIGEMSPALQAKLLRVLEYGEFERVGGSETIKVDVRLLTATHRNLEKMVAKGQFRADLFYRINVFPLQLPPLRERVGDLPLMAYHFLYQAVERNDRRLLAIESEALDLIEHYPWPGNLRELENAMERAVLLSDGVALRAQDFPHLVEWAERQIPDEVDTGEPTGVLKPAPNVEDGSLIRSLAEVEREAILRALQSTRGSISLAARGLGIGRTTLYRKIEDYGIELKEEAAESSIETN